MRLLRKIPVILVLFICGWLLIHTSMAQDSTPTDQPFTTLYIESIDAEYNGLFDGIRRSFERRHIIIVDNPVDAPASDPLITLNFKSQPQFTLTAYFTADTPAIDFTHTSQLLTGSREYFRFQHIYSTDDTTNLAERRIVAYLSFFMGNHALSQQDYERAVIFYEAAVIEFRSHEFSNAPLEAPSVNLAWTYVQLGRNDDAIRVMTELINMARDTSINTFLQFEDEPTYRLEFQAQNLTRRAQIYALMFDYDDAIADMDRAIVLQPLNPHLYLIRGQMILLIYEWDRVIADYNRAIRLYPNYADAYFYRGILLYTQYSSEAALVDFQHYLELAPDGEFTEQAAQYIEAIERELQTLND